LPVADTGRSFGEAQVLPWPERAVYFLRRVLHYSCQETALLLGMSHAQIDQFYKFAAKRIAY
jgi:DNA-directed RNA polymerase specialized sigma24 family protein